MKEGNKVYTGISLDKEILEKLDKQRRDQASKEGRDISRSSYINEMIIRGLQQ